VTAEGEECDGDDGFGAVVPELNPADLTDLGVGTGSLACRTHWEPDLCRR
jgi:hypothetical protein